MSGFKLQFSPGGVALWTEEADRTLKAMLDDKMTTGQIAAAIGASRSAVAGRMMRNGWKSQSGLGRWGRPADAVDRQRWEDNKKSADKKKAIKLSVVSNNVDLMVKDWIRKNRGPRRFERGFSTDYLCLRQFLEPHGFTLTLDKNVPVIAGARGRPRKATWTEVYALVDKYRVAKGLTPILAGAP